ncbi:DUF4166 domain-containing protein [Roseovarius aestuarii]|uniref:DUF4166 domain-containing protein n=1 Tax=Roseovarius aestuarii TaxID=475083 RepID=A0A1X7BTP4_9RHOB|nr:DUF4166 domain-containing protein [Roseovarius aestuarii]SMC12599.1 hypothetical protein ROA7745_02427 [Roseovarius aestuarii]
MSGDPFWHAIRAQRLDVPSAVLTLHSGQGTKHYVGQCDITRGSGVLARLALRLAGFPSAGQKVPTRLTINTREGQSEWVRDFGGHVTRSHLSFDSVRCRIIERFGPVRLTLSLGVIPGKLCMEIASLHLFGVPVPCKLVPLSQTVEYEDPDARFCFDVSARVRGVGFLIRYAGVLVQE